MKPNRISLLNQLFLACFIFLQFAFLVVWMKVRQNISYKAGEMAVWHPEQDWKAWVESQQPGINSMLLMFALADIIYVLVWIALNFARRNR